MIDTTTSKDLAMKIEWVGLRSLSHSERELVGSDLTEVSRYLPRLLALALWSYFGQVAPENLLTRSSEGSLRSYREREESKAFFSEILRGRSEEESSL